MAVLTIIKYFLGFAFGYILYILFGRVVYETRYENSMWDDMPANIQAWGDQVYGIWILVAVVIAAVLLLAAWSESNRRRALQQ